MAGSESTKVEIPEWLETPTRAVIQKGEQVGQVGYTPYYGPDVAAFTPMQNAAMQNTSGAANAFGLAGGQNMMPQATEFAGGVQGYSSQPLYEQSVANFAAENPNQYGFMQSFFVDPKSGQYSGGQPGGVGTSGDPVSSFGGGGGKGGGQAGPAEYNSGPSPLDPGWGFPDVQPRGLEAVFGPAPSFGGGGNMFPGGMVNDVRDIAGDRLGGKDFFTGGKGW